MSKKKGGFWTGFIVGIKMLAASIVPSVLLMGLATLFVQSATGAAIAYPIAYVLALVISGMIAHKAWKWK